MSSEKAAAVKKPAPKSAGTELSPLKRITHFLVSMKLALTLLFVIALLSIIGTFLPQGETVYETDWVNNPLFDFYNTLGLFDMYTWPKGWWFLGTLALLMANMTVCISKRLPTTYKNFMRPRVDVKDAFVQNQPLNTTISGKGRHGLPLAIKTFRKHHYRVREGKSGAVMVEKGRFTPLASICFHLSFVVLAIGFIVGIRMGFDEQVHVPEGWTVDVPGTEKMTIRNNNFTVEQEEIVEKETGRIVGYKPSLFASDVDVFEEGEMIDSHVIEVNSPMRIKTHLYDIFNLEGVNFYQTNYYPMDDRSGYVTVLQVNQMPGKTLIYLGFIMMMVGVTFGIYFPHRRVWLKTGKNGDLIMGGRTNRSKVSFQKDFDRIAAELRTTLKQEGKS